jgi:hypothetical protein
MDLSSLEELSSSLVMLRMTKDLINISDIQDFGK